MVSYFCLIYLLRRAIEDSLGYNERSHAPHQILATVIERQNLLAHRPILLTEKKKRERRHRKKVELPDSNTHGRSRFHLLHRQH